MPEGTPSQERLAGMTVNERLLETGLIDAFADAAERKDLARVREILESVHVDELSIVRTLARIESRGRSG